jgi:branched-chain amino acid transport system substrate-binding protein
VRARLSILACLAAMITSILAAGAQGRPSAGEAPQADPGVTNTSVKIGGTVPLSGVAAAYASVGKGAEAYFKYVNARGGVNGRKIEYVIKDDAYNPANTVQATRELVQQDQVFAIYNSLGTEHNLATRPFLNQLKVPQVFVASGASTFGNDYKRYPYSIGYLPNYVAEGRIYGKSIGRIKARAKVAVLFQDDSYGKELLAGLKQGLRFAGRGGRIVASQGYAVTSTDVQSQITRLKSSRADVLLIAATPAHAIRAYIAANKIGWKPRIIINQVASGSNTMRIVAASAGKLAEGSVSINFLKDPTDPRWSTDAGGRLYRQIMRRHCSGCNSSDVYNVYAMASAHTFVNALKRAGRNLTRAGLMRALTSINESNNPFLLPGIRVSTTARDRFPIKQARLQRWVNGRWRDFGPLVSARGGRV